MEQFITGIPTTFIGWIGTVLVIVGAFSYFWKTRRSEDLKLLRDTNKDQGDRIALLEKSVSSQNESIVLLQAKVKLLENKNKTLEDLVAIALKQYFFEHPDMAESMKDKILEGTV